MYNIFIYIATFFRNWPLSIVRVLYYPVKKATKESGTELYEEEQFSEPFTRYAIGRESRFQTSNYNNKQAH